MSFPTDTIDALHAAKILGVRSGAEHKYTGVWVVVVDGRVFVRSWSNKPGGWYRAFRAELLGSIQVGAREIPVHAKHVRSATMRDAVTRAFAAKYNTKGSQKWVEGFGEEQRLPNTLEFVSADGTGKR